MNAIIKVSAVIGLCVATLGLVLEVIFPPLAFVASVIFIGCIIAAIALELKE